MDEKNQKKKSSVISLQMYRRLDYRCEGREKVGALSGQVMPLDRS
jgi:hypothetical protein